MASITASVLKLSLALGLLSFLSPVPYLSALAQETPTDGVAWQNSVGMKFVPAGTTGILFSVWETRVKDFEQFVRATHYDATRGMYRVSFDDVNQHRDNWKHPGFTQTPDCPVAAVSWYDAHAFCHWLTEKERWEHVIRKDQSYRLPTDAEWSAALGSATYPWGEQPPLPLDAGNYARKGDGLNSSSFEGRDGYENTSPVGNFRPNVYGLYDMGGNVWEWCEDFYRKEMNDADARKVYPVLNMDDGGQTCRVLRGASWRSYKPIRMRSSARESLPPDYRYNYDGFRCVLVVAPPKSDSVDGKNGW